MTAGPVGRVTDLEGLDALAETVGWNTQPEPADLPFTGGGVGMLTDDLAPGLLDLDGRLALARAARVPLPALHFGVYDTAVCIAVDGSQAWVVASELPVSIAPAALRARRWHGHVVRLAHHGTDRRDHAEEEDVLAGLAGRSGPLPGLLAAGPVVTGLDRGQHRAAIQRAQEWIAAGDLYQLNLTLQVSVPWAAGPGALARRLWGASPGSAHAAHLVVDGVHIVSISPETFLRIRDGIATIRPIKGTRPRRQDPVSDRAQAEALQASTKDAAEHVMIVDLERNDLGRVCEPGTVRVPFLAGLEAHPTVWHLTSTVQGRLRPDIRLSDALAATFPCGSVTGAPKRMAWDRITRLEPVRRGVYCGAIGVVTAGRVDLSVAIRTAVLHDGFAHYGTGGGIVADSRPDDEWDEAMDKAQAFLMATGARRPG